MKQFSFDIKEFSQASNAANCCRTEMQRHLLILDHDALLREKLVRAFSERGFAVQSARSWNDWESAGHAPFAYAIIAGHEALPQIKARFPSCQVLVVSEEASISAAVQAMKNGAAHYMARPARIEEIEAAFEECRAGGSPAAEISNLYEHERAFIEKVLNDCSGNISRAARALGIHRQSLQRKLKKYS